MASTQTGDSPLRRRTGCWRTKRGPARAGRAHPQRLPQATAPETNDSPAAFGPPSGPGAASSRPTTGLPKRRRRRWVLVLCAALLLVGYAVLLEPNRIVQERIEVRAPRLARALSGGRIVHLSDLHLVSAGGLAERVASSVRRLDP